VLRERPALSPAFFFFRIGLIKKDPFDSQNPNFREEVATSRNYGLFLTVSLGISFISRFLMIQTPWLLVCCIALLSCGGCASSNLAQYTDYTVGVGQAYPAEQATAQKRVDRYLAHLKPSEKERLASVEYIAVEATTVSISDVPGLASRIASGRLRGETSISSSDRHEVLSGNAKFIMIFDPKTGQPLNQEGYVAVETPRKVKVGIFGVYTALYIGNGR
jgi:hypothetical protein